jgi:hypothetical protein
MKLLISFRSPQKRYRKQVNFSIIVAGYLKVVEIGHRAPVAPPIWRAIILFVDLAVFGPQPWTGWRVLVSTLGYFRDPKHDLAGHVFHEPVKIGSSL